MPHRDKTLKRAMARTILRQEPRSECWRLAAVVGSTEKTWQRDSAPGPKQKDERRLRRTRCLLDVLELILDEGLVVRVLARGAQQTRVAKAGHFLERQRTAVP